MFFKVGLIFVIFLLTTGMSVILKDGNYVDVDSYYFRNGKIIFKIKNKIYELNERFVDKDETLKLNYLEEKKITILKNYTSFVEKINNNKLSIDAPKVYKHESDIKVKIEMRKEQSPFFIDGQVKDENFLEKIQRKGIMIKIQVPVIEDKK